MHPHPEFHPEDAEHIAHCMKSVKELMKRAKLSQPHIAKALSQVND